MRWPGEREPQTGLSPRVRGNHRRRAGLSACCGSIPARAGEPFGFRRSVVSSRVYPRACGGTPRLRKRKSPAAGLSPRVRGNQLKIKNKLLSRGSIPARAGEPLALLASVLSGKVYPRACGGTRPPSAAARPRQGLSPRVRGNRTHRKAAERVIRSIPARAGEPRRAARARSRPRVYPRACGGTVSRSRPSTLSAGLSPRVRGNRSAPRPGAAAKGSIPARAGEPHAELRARATWRVYPRACGGTSRRVARACDLEGLSPRVRGNLRLLIAGAAGDRSIPARAGEPRSSCGSKTSSRVYPRACGGTVHAYGRAVRGKGLSPRVRGNPEGVGFRAGFSRSIPARAGEPRCLSSFFSFSGVYPRACGGTRLSGDDGREGWGLSPRVRGNQVVIIRGHALQGSIPARAGEPYPSPAGGPCTRVYPRACGGTLTTAPSRGSCKGLSPRVRGNPRARWCPTAASGSIPARAGEP